jgi:hypothetical protein
MPWFSKSACVGLHDGPYFETQSFQGVSCFLCTEFSYFTFEDVAKQLWRRF